jgi:hypothetical protein
MSTYNKSIVELSEYKGNALIVLKASEDSKWPFQFGVSKARLILENIDAIQAFVASNGTTLEREV